MNFFTNLKERSDVKWLSTAREVECLLDDYLAQLEAGAAAKSCECSIFLVVSSVCSPAAYAVVKKSDRLAACGVRLKVVLADSSDEQALGAFRSVFSCLSETPEFRQAVNPALLEANEQLFLGLGLSWSGDTLRRVEQSNALSIIKRGPGGAVQYGRQAFSALWAASAPLFQAKHARCGVHERSKQAGADIASPLGVPKFLNEDDGELYPVH